MSHWHHKTINLALIPPAAYSQFPQFITREHHQRFQFAPAFSIHYTRIHHSRFQFAEFITPIPIRPSLLNSSHANSSPAISICPSLLNSSHANSSPAIPICCIIIHVQLRSFAPTSAHSPLPPLIQPCLLASNSLLYVYNNKIMTLSPTILPIIR